MFNRGITCDHDQRDVVGFLAEQIEELQPRHPRHLEIGDDQLDFAVCERLQGLRNTPCANGAMTRSQERVFKQQTDRRIIVDV